MFLLAFRNLRARAGRTLFTAFAVALGVALVFATSLVGVLIEQSARAAREGRLAGADLEVRAARAAFFPDTLADRLLARPEVEGAAPLYRQTLPEAGLNLLGVDPARVLSPYELAAGNFFSARDAFEILLPTTWAAQHGLGVGQTLTLKTGPEGQTHDYAVVGLLKSANALDTSTAWLPLKTMQAVFDAPGAATAVLVRLKPSFQPEAVRSVLQDDLGRPYVVISAGGGADIRTDAQALTDFALPLADGAVLLSGAYLIFNAFAITLTERRRLLGQLRALGMTRGQILRVTLIEALLTALMGAAAGLVLGYGLAQGLVVVLGDAPTRASVPLADIVRGAFIAVTVGVGVTLGVTFNLAWQAGQVSPLAALRVESSITTKRGFYERWGWVAAILLFVIAWGAHVWILDAVQQSNLDWNNVFLPLLLLMGVPLLALPVGVRGAVWLFRRLTARGAVAFRLAAGSLARQPARAILTTATFTITNMLIVLLAGISLSQGTFLIDRAGGLFRDDFVLVLGNILGDVPALPISASLQTQLDGLQSQAEIVSLAVLHLPDYDSGNDNSTVAATLDYARAHPAYFRPVEGTLDEAAQYFASGPALAVNELPARRKNWHVGDTVLVDTLEGQVPFKVALIVQGFALVTPEVAARYFGVHPQFIFFNARPGVAKDSLHSALQDLARQQHLTLQEPSKFLNDTFDQIFGSIFALFGGLASLSGILAGLSLINTLVASVLERQSELGTLRALGMARGQVRALIVVEAGVLGLLGTLIGVLGGLTLAYMGMRIVGVQFEPALGPMTDFPPLPWAVAGMALLINPAIAMLAALWPADRAVAVNPADAMRAEGATGFLKPAKHLGPIGLRGLVARMPLAAKLSFTLGLVFILTLTVTTALRVTAERRLVEDNLRSILQRGFDAMLNTISQQISADITRITPETETLIQAQAGAQIETFTAFFQGDANSPYDFTPKYVILTDPAQKVLTSDRAEYIGRTLTATAAFNGATTVVRLTDWTGERVFEAALPLKNQAGKHLGTAYIGFSAEPVDSVTRAIIRSSLWTMLVALMVAVTLTIFLTRRALVPVAEVVAASHAVARGDLTRRVPETRWDDVGQLNRAFNEMVGGLNDRERMRDLFGRYLSREVSEAVLAGRVSLTGERKTITCLYVDMRGSTSFAEKYQPEEVVSALNGYFEVIILATEAHGGIVNRFVGDAAVCVFGAPRDYRDHADRALQAALAMRDGLAYLNRKRETLNLPTLKFGMGLNSGEVVAGATGSEERQEYTVIGDAMNVGARIQALNKTFPDYDILLSEFTVNILKAEYKLVDLGPVELRGKSEQVRVFGVKVGHSSE